MSARMFVLVLRRMRAQRRAQRRADDVAMRLYRARIARNGAAVR